MICEPVDINDDEHVVDDRVKNTKWPTSNNRPHEVEFDIDGRSEGAKQIRNLDDRESERTQNTTAELLEIHPK